MIHSDLELQQMDVAAWTPEEGFLHLKKTFDIAASRYPEIMEPHEIRLEDGEQTISGQQAVMRGALRETFGQRR